MSVTLLTSSAVRDTVDHAIQAKLAFGEDYDMYVSYLGQWSAGRGHVGITPLSPQEYARLIAC